MHGRRSLVAPALLTLMILGGLVSAPAGADAVLLWRFEQRPDGLPATTEPAQTLSTAYADLGISPAGSALHATVELAGVPTPETAADLHLRIGTVDAASGGCVTDWELVVPTLDPSGPASRDGTTISVAVSTDRPDDTDLRCGSVSLMGADGAVLDELADDQSSLVIADPGARARIERVTGTHVRAGHWSTVWVRVGHRGAEAEGVEVTGAGSGVRVRAYTAHLTLHEGDEVWAPLEVLVRGHTPRPLKISARPFGNLAFVFPGTRQVLLRPAP